MTPDPGRPVAAIEPSASPPAVVSSSRSLSHELGGTGLDCPYRFSSDDSATRRYEPEET